MSLDIPYGNSANGTTVQQVNGLYESSKFNLVALSNGNYKITMKANPNKCLDNPVGSVNGSHPQIWDCSGATNQQWQLNLDSATGAYFIKSNSSGGCIDQPGGSLTGGLFMQMYTCAATNKNQKFLFKSAP